MKKNIPLVTLDASFLQWLHEQTRRSAPSGEARIELLEGLEQLQAHAGMLLLEYGEAPSAAFECSLLQLGALTIDARSHTVQRDGKEIPLTPKEFDILFFLARNQGEVFTKEQIYQAVWDGDYLLDDSNIMAFIRKLRKKIEPDPDAPQYILTIWGIGYKFNDRL